MQHDHFVFQLPSGELRAAILSSEVQRKNADKYINGGQTFKVAGTIVEVKGLMSKKDYEGLKIFFDKSGYEKWKANSLYFKKYKSWPKG